MLIRLLLSALTASGLLMFVNIMSGYMHAIVVNLFVLSYKHHLDQ